MTDADWARDRLQSGEAARREKRLDDARTEFAAAADWYAAHDSFEMRAHVLTRQAQIERDLGSYETAIAHQREALKLQRQLGSKGLGHTVRHLADILDDAGRHQEATPLYAEMERLCRANPDTPPLEMANAIRSLAVNAERLGNAQDARRLWSEARQLYSELDQLFLNMTGEARNPGVEEADKRLTALR
jgi:tetratricopeptide (TPR) repeat protein